MCSKQFKKTSLDDLFLKFCQQRSLVKRDPGSSPEERPVQAGALAAVRVRPAPGEGAVPAAPPLVQLPRGAHAG